MCETDKNPNDGTIHPQLRNFTRQVCRLCSITDLLCYVNGQNLLLLLSLLLTVAHGWYTNDMSKWGSPATPPTQEVCARALSTLSTARCRVAPGVMYARPQHTSSSKPSSSPDQSHRPRLLRKACRQRTRKLQRVGIQLRQIRITTDYVHEAYQNNHRIRP